MNKKIIFVVSLIIVIGGVAWGILYYLSQHIVTIKLTDKTSVQLVQNPTTKDRHVVSSFSNDTNIRLNQANYCVYPTDSASYNTSTGTCFSVKDRDISITITPEYSTNKLQALLSNEITSIKAVITAKYAPIISNYRLADGALYLRGQWYGTTLTEVTPPNERGDVYRLVLEKVNNQWVIMARPALALNKYDYPQIPHSVLDAVNKQDGTY